MPRKYRNTRISRGPGLLGQLHPLEPLVLRLQEHHGVEVTQSMPHARRKPDRSGHDEACPRAHSRDHDPQQVVQGGVLDGADLHRHRPVPEEVALDLQPRDVPHPTELPVPGQRVRQGGPPEPLERLEREGGLRRLDEPRDPGVEPPQMEGARRRGPVLGAPRPESDEVVRPARLGAGADGGALPPAERLPLHDRPGGAAVD
ncbi:unnamed protein product, partial [Penicillium discolor]